MMWAIVCLISVFSIGYQVGATVEMLRWNKKTTKLLRDQWEEYKRISRQ